jgi:CTP synthase
VHSGAENSVKVKVRAIDAEECEREDPAKLLKGVHGILVPGGFGERGVEGKINAIKYARENKIPFLGICLGLQCAVIEFARNVCGISLANSAEFKKNRYNVIDIMEEQKNVKHLGGSMRLGAYPCKIEPGTHAADAYKTDLITERHRHRYEVNNRFRNKLQEKGLIYSGVSPDRELIEMIELPDHPWFLGCQFHPELKSRAVKAHPLFRDFIKAAKSHAKSETK